MKTKNIEKQLEKSIHQHIEQLLRHRAVLLIVMLVMFVGITAFDTRMRSLLRDAYSQGFGMIGAYSHYEHTAHRPMEVALTREVQVTGS